MSSVPRAPCWPAARWPVQALLHSSHMYHEAKHAFANHGIMVDNPRVDLGAAHSTTACAVGVEQGRRGQRREAAAREGSNVHSL